LTEVAVIIALPIVLLALLLLAMYVALAIWKTRRFANSWERQAGARERLTGKFYKCLIFTLFLM
jgi:hypothetical protein